MVLSLGYVLLLQFLCMMHCCWNGMKASEFYLAITEGNIRSHIYFCKHTEISVNDADMHWFSLIQFAAQEAHWLHSSITFFFFVLCVPNKMCSLEILRPVCGLFWCSLSLCSFLSILQSYNGRVLCSLSWLSPHY